MNRVFMVLCLLFAIPIGVARAASNFDDLALDSESYWNGSDGSGQFTSGEASLNNFYDDTFGPYWEGFAYSNVTDNETPGYGNQYSVITGGGAGGSNQYAIAYANGFYGTIPTVNFAEPVTVSGAYFTNTAYAFWAMRDGDGFSKKFGGDTGDDPDWFLLTITGRDDADNVTGTVHFYLADFRFDDNSKDYIVEQWTWVDLTGLGAVNSLEFTLTSSDTGEYGMNTPAYFAVDDIDTFVDADADGIPDDQEVEASSSPASSDDGGGGGGGCFVGASLQGWL